MNSLTGQELGTTGAQVKSFKVSMDRVRFSRTMKIEVGRSSKMHFQTQKPSSGSLGQRRSDQEDLADWLCLGNRRKGQGDWVKLGSDLSELLWVRDQ